MPKAGDWYAAARIAAEAQSKLRHFVMDRSLPASRRLHITLVTDTNADVSGIRTAGFRLALLANGSREATSVDSFPSGVGVISGGQAETSVSGFESLSGRLTPDQPGENPVVIYISVSMFAGMDRQHIFAAATRAAVGLSGQADSGAVRFILPMDYLLQYQGRYSRRVAVAFADTEIDGRRSQEKASLVEGLLVDGIPLALISPLAAGGPALQKPRSGDARLDSCIALSATPDTDRAGYCGSLWRRE